MSEISKQALSVENTTNFPNNNTGYITPALLRSFNTDLIDSTVNQIVYTADSASWNSKISQLNAFTASQQPSFTAINAFTASQLNINSGYNTFTQSAGAELDSLSAWTGSWNDWTSSINEIRDDGVLQGYSTRFYFNGLVSASVVQNVNGPIANVTIQQDGTKLDTGSFNTYTASNAASQSVFSASVSASITSVSSSLYSVSASQAIWNASATASIQELLNLSSSLSGGYATQGELDYSSSVLQANINTKLNTSSFNDYTASTNGVISTLATTASVNQISSSISSSILSLSASIEDTDTVQTDRINTLASYTGSYATTGSNRFIGNENITGSLTITGSVYQNVNAVSIASSTASIDLSAANYFTLTVTGATNINVTNPRPGVTATIVITAGTAATASFSSNVKQVSGSAYVISPSGSTDIISLTSVDTTNVYLVPAYSFV